MNSKEKEAVRESFLKASKPTILLITSGAGGVGLNLQGASILIQTEVWWNKNTERQAYARIYRQGQSKQVKIFRLRGLNSAIDRNILDCQERKTYTNEKIMRLLVRRHDDPVVVPEFTP
jgi:SNF2 family DNA or RNA helicase